MKQKQFTRTTQITGLALLSGVLVGAMLPSPAQAKPFPKKGYILQDKNTADIGRRASTLDAQRAALRMMARMMKWSFKKDHYQVDWTTLDDKGAEQQDGASFGIVEDQMPQKPEDQKPSLITGGSVYWPVSQSMIRRVALYNGSFRDLTRYRAVDQIQNVHIDLGVRKSYDAGSRATLRVLAKRLQSPFSSSYLIRWSYPLRNKVLNEVTVRYDPSPTQNYLLVESSPVFDRRGIFKSVAEASIIRVGRHSGTFEDLLKKSIKKEED